MTAFFPFGKFIVSPDELNPKNHWITFVTPRGYSVVLLDKNEKRLQAIAAHLNGVISGEIALPKNSQR